MKDYYDIALPVRGTVIRSNGEPAIAAIIATSGTENAIEADPAGLTEGLL